MSNATDRSIPAGPVAERALPIALTGLLAAVSAFGPLSMDMYLPALPQVGTDLGAGASTVALTLTAATAGLGAGQLIVGPLSDRLGRRRPMLVGLVVFSLLSLACAVAPNVWLLITFRLLQAFGGAAGIVLSRAIARDLRSGPSLVRLFTLLLSINGLAPVIAPVIGAQLIRITSWRGIFVVLAVIGAIMVVATLRVLPETLPVADRQRGGLAAAGHAYRELLRHTRFVLLALGNGMAFSVMFTYIATSAFVLEDEYGLSAQLFSLDFALNAVALVIGTRLSSRVDPRISVTQMLAGAGAVLVGALGAGLPVVLLGFVLVTAGIGLLSPPMIAQGMDTVSARSAGSASALIGAAQFLLGGLIGPLGSINASHSAVPLGLTMTAAAVVSLVIALLAFGRHLAVPAPD